MALGCPSAVLAANTKTVAANDPAIRYVGRTLVSPDNSVSYDWAGTYFETILTGGKLSARLSEKGNAYYNVFVDGKEAGVVKTCGTDTVIDFVSGIGKAPHKVRIQKRTEGEFGRTTLHEFILAKNGSVTPVTDTPKRHIEFIGNSLTCGFGVDDPDKTHPFKLETENCNHSFSNIIPRYFDADYTLIAHSGQGVVRNYGDSVRVSKRTMTERMLNTFDEDPDIMWDFKAYKPDLVVINLGSNDFSDPAQPYKSEFIASFKRMIKNIRDNYGNVPVVTVYSPTVPYPVFDYFEAAVAETGDPDIHLFKMEPNLFNTDFDYGAVWHPNCSGQRKMAMSLIPYISTITGWEMTTNPVE